MSETRKKIYIAGPYTKGDVAVNVAEAIRAADWMIAYGLIPFIPHLTHFWHLLYQHPYAFWMDYDNEWLRSCDAVFRLPGESSGADKEEEQAHEWGVPVFHDAQDLLQWSAK